MHGMGTQTTSEKELHIKWCQIAEQQLHNQIIPWNQALSQVA